MNNKKKSILIVDDHPIMREGITQIINNQNDLFVIAEAESGQEALKILSKIKPDLAIVDISLKGMNGLELTKEINRNFNDIPILILSMHPEKFYAERAIKAGAMGYLQKHEPSTTVVEATISGAVPVAMSDSNCCAVTLNEPASQSADSPLVPSASIY